MKGATKLKWNLVKYIVNLWWTELNDKRQMNQESLYFITAVFAIHFMLHYV
jgi:hypothetical protein